VEEQQVDAEGVVARDDRVFLSDERKVAAELEARMGQSGLSEKAAR